MKGMFFKPWKIQFIAEHPDMEIMTRRVIKTQIGLLAEFDHFDVIGQAVFTDGTVVMPRYQVGETVYIKEAWKIEHNIKGCPKLDDIVTVECVNGSAERQWSDIIDNQAGIFLYSVAKAFDNGLWQNPMFMPEVLARHFITITDVGAERLQEITTDDAKAEGIRIFNMGIDFTFSFERAVTIGKFKELWNSINKEKWESNPWVFPYTFRLKEEHEQN